jgi:Tol biopolymer transport system component
MFGDRKPVPVADTPFEENGGRFSPDSRWIAYQATESGRPEIYVQRFPERNQKAQISTAGGTRPQWKRDGRELFYVANNQLMAVPITTADSSVTAGTPMALFPMRAGSDYTASADGQRFLVSRLAEEAAPITILLNWNRSPTHGGPP